MRRHDLLGKVIGLIVFLGGIAVLAFVFLTAYHLFHSPLGTIQTSTNPGSTAPATEQIGRSALKLLVRIALLIVMTIVGSLVAGRGVQMYFASGDRHPRESITPQD